MLLYVNNKKYICAICDKTDILKILFLYRDPPNDDEIYQQYDAPKESLNEIINELLSKNWSRAYIPDINIKGSGFDHTITLDDIHL